MLNSSKRAKTADSDRPIHCDMIAGLSSGDCGELDRRMQQPQRHRLLHGYPLPRLMPAIEPNNAEAPAISPKPLLLGVLPHSFCTPKVRGCGFCTFPHEQFQKKQMARVTAAVTREIERTVERSPHLLERTVKGLYFGGGTANLTPPAPFARICQMLERHFDLAQAEVTLEGVPRYFLSHSSALMTIVQKELSARHFRISMGIQTFNCAWLERMGRSAFGTVEHVAKVVAAAAARGMTTSGDFLVNLPGDSNSRIAQDLHTASDLGLDQICLYNLVLSPKLTVPWARDAKMLREMPDNHRAYKRWAYARQLLFELGYVQTTLTNFERAPVSGSRWGSGHRFSYERDSFQPQKVDALGFGPAAISTFSSADFETSVKTINAVNSHQFAADIEQSGQATRKQFVYAPQDLRLLFITRSLSLLSISKPIYRSLFGSSIEQDYAGVLSALEHRGLVTRGDSDIVPTRKGMFYADAVAGTFASPRVRALRRDMTEPEANSNIYSHM